jgi:hypothetical protein
MANSGSLDSPRASAARVRLARMIAAGRVEGVLDAELREIAKAEGVLPLLEWMSGRLSAIRSHAAVQLARRARLSRVLDLLARDGVSAVVIKGAHLAHTCYPDPALRPHVDIDLLIDARDVDAARRVFDASGHRLIPHVTGRFVMSQFHYADSSDGMPGLHAYDVHWQLANPAAFRDRLPFDTIRLHSVPIEAFGQHGRGPSLPHALVIACIHRAAHHGASDRLIWLNDLRLLLKAATTAQIDEFCRIADASGLNAVCHDACARTAQLFRDVQVPVLLAVRGVQSAEPSRAYLEAPSPLKQMWLDLRALNGWGDRAALVREHLFPPAAYMRGSVESRTPLPWAYAARIARGFVTYVRSARL